MGNRTDYKGGRHGVSITSIFCFCFLYLQFFVFSVTSVLGFGSFFFIFQRQGFTISSYLWKASCPLFWWQRQNPLPLFSPYSMVLTSTLSLKIYSSFVPLDFEDSSLFFENLLTGSCMRSKASTSRQDEGGCKSFPCTAAPGVFSCSLPRKPGFPKCQRWKRNE